MSQMVALMPLKVLYTTWVWDVSIFFRQLHLSSIDQPFLRQTLAGAEKNNQPRAFQRTDLAELVNHKMQIVNLPLLFHKVKA